ncbi:MULTISPECIES: hypothetical protein [Haloarcula]|uniref:hypothetical protein n=1 Tax=Haloarcula TaxID=2237 RepID=UPI0023EBD43C|nr:hypothetical protein [Halomicroarcula sp. XH51]
MRAARLVTDCFLYCGVVLLLNNLVVYGVRVSVESVANYGLAVVIAFVGFSRLLRPEIEAQRPAEYGFFTYVMVGLAVVLTVLVVAQLVAV